MKRLWKSRLEILIFFSTLRKRKREKTKLGANFPLIHRKLYCQKRVKLCNTKYPIFTGFFNIGNRAWLGYVPVEAHQIRELSSSGE
jgi:hypothetical protein